MKRRIFTIISFLFLIIPFASSQKLIVQTIPVNPQLISVQTSLPEQVEILPSETYEIKIETKIFYEKEEEATVDYTINQGHYELTTHFSYDEATLVIKPKRINTTILTKGKKHQTRRQYRIYLPSHLCYVD